MAPTGYSFDVAAMTRLKSYVLDAWTDGEGEGSALINPTTEETVATASTAGIDRAAMLQHGREVGGPALRAMTFAERGELLKAMSKALHDAREELITASMINGGTPRGDAKFDIDGATGTLSYYASLGKKLGDKKYLVEGEGEQLTRSARFWGHHIKSARRGVAIHINAFNFPAWGLFEKAAVALLAGMPVVTKPGTSTALLAHRCMEKIVEADILPKGALQLLCGSAGDLLEHVGPQDVLAFTGSGDTGAHLRGMKAVIGNSVRVNIEADSLNATVLGTDVEVGSEAWHMFIADTAKEITQKTGQKCTATRRIMVPAAKLDAVAEALGEEMGRTQFGAPDADGVRMGPLATKQQLDDVRAGVDRLLSNGCREVWRSSAKPVGAVEGKGFFFAPMLLACDAPHECATVHAYEVFGPVSTLLPYTDAHDAAALVARGEGGLVASIYTDDRNFLSDALLGIAPWTGRILVGSKKVQGQATGPGVVLPSCVHGGPGRAGGGEELGGLRGLDFYSQRTAIQGDRALLDRVLGLK
ncbi:MAG: 3,4-dehydroadipyl-CoA semialdehyde dehydrogenase [Polyangiales bacterium]|jgi:3,4-dehydroadipyl-CoA semialdehyde dehydrogenase